MTNPLKGVELIHEKLKHLFQGFRASEVKAGDAFDADFAEAITQIPAPSARDERKKLMFLKRIQIGDKIIRFPKVVIGQ
jgi:molecular chaperone GrpE